jgi:hypothetical protein
VQRAYATSTRILSVLILVAGLAMIVATLARGGGALALGLVLGVAFVLVGAARLWLTGQARPGGGQE